MLPWIGLRCEWAKSKARADRWDEEVQLVIEEMQRVLAFLEWKASWWDRQGKAQLNVSHDILQGACAYAAKQAYVNRALAASFEMCWRAEVGKARASGSSYSSFEFTAAMGIAMDT